MTQNNNSALLYKLKSNWTVSQSCYMYIIVLNNYLEWIKFFHLQYIHVYDIQFFVQVCSCTMYIVYVTLQHKIAIISKGWMKEATILIHNTKMTESNDPWELPHNHVRRTLKRKRLTPPRYPSNYMLFSSMSRFTQWAALNNNLSDNRYIVCQNLHHQVLPRWMWVTSLIGWSKELGWKSTKEPIWSKQLEVFSPVLH